jgi:hypothetical protein
MTDGQRSFGLPLGRLPNVARGCRRPTWPAPSSPTCGSPEVEDADEDADEDAPAEPTPERAIAE